MVRFTRKQQCQETQYGLPYHYRDLLNEEYKFLYSIEYLSYLRVVRDLLKPFKGRFLLDAGCGDGRFCYELRNDNIKLVGVDYSERAIVYARAFNPNAQFFVGDLKEINIPYKFDYITLIETLEHIIPKQIPLLLHSLSNLLKDNGKLIITVPSVNLPLVEKHYQHFSEENLKEVLECDFEVVKIFGYSSQNFRKRIFSKLRMLGFLMYPFRNNRYMMRFVGVYYRFLADYYERHLALGEPGNSNGIIAVCRKKNR